jgi:1-acyl-sn-glycerol-3-phosphate acyltransferase
VSASPDQSWSRTAVAGVLRELVLWGVFGPIVTSYSRREIDGHRCLDGLPGPVIFVPNHSSHVDTPVLLMSLPARWRRRTAVGAAADYFYGHPLLAAAVSLGFGAVPIERRADRASLEVTDQGERLIERGWSLVLFAEGTRSRDGRIGVLRSGAAMLAARTGVPIVPVHIAGTRAAMAPGRAWMVRPETRRWAQHTFRICFGDPIAVARAEDRLEAMERVRLFMAGCGAATTPDPKLAARRAAAGSLTGASRCNGAP